MTLDSMKPSDRKIWAQTATQISKRAVEMDIAKQIAAEDITKLNRFLTKVINNPTSRRRLDPSDAKRCSGSRQDFRWRKVEKAQFAILPDLAKRDI